ncbi:MAG: hypothetical protein U0K72_08950 [Lachnospiraceae bacterium]|nr:hypothetical protein [Lachnospiraceae bacterium]
MELGLISAVEGVAKQRALLGCHVEADLVGSAGFQVEGEALVGFAGPEGFIEGSGGFTERRRNHAQTVFGIRSHWSVDSSPSVRVCRCLAFFQPPDDFTPSGEFFHFVFFFDGFLLFFGIIVPFCRNLCDGKIGFL